MTRAPGFREKLEEAIRAYDIRANSAGLVHGEVNTDQHLFQLAWVGLEVDYEQLHDVAGEYAGIGIENIVEGIPPENVLAGLWAHGVIIGLLLMQLRQTERARRGDPDGRPGDEQGSGS